MHDQNEKIQFEENVCQLQQAREFCQNDNHVVKLKKILEECNTRVNSRKKTTEICQMEMVDYIEALDHCAMPKAFSALK